MWAHRVALDGSKGTRTGCDSGEAAFSTQGQWPGWGTQLRATRHPSSQHLGGTPQALLHPRFLCFFRRLITTYPGGSQHPERILCSLGLLPWGRPLSLPPGYAGSVPQQELGLNCLSICPTCTSRLVGPNSSGHTTGLVLENL